ncbi:MAG: prepilin-type N-terminal cleavage/methylation domain-containing protein [Betaproteobacteria bacterium]|nr:prepilin-type N-terminal cleavage/methylation domain-containing protein [Betaproteobacteria bacterium]
MNRARERGFTMLETVVALTLLAVMLGMLFTGLRTGLRAWDAGLGRAERADQLLLTMGFLRRDLSNAFPWRLKDPVVTRLAFLGERERVRFVSSRPAEVGGGGLAFVSVAYEAAAGPQGAGKLVMRREFAAANAQDLATLDEAEKFTLLEEVTAARLEYFGSENDVIAPAWSDRWEVKQRMPSHVRLSMEVGGRKLSPIVIALRLGEEAGCFEGLFQRQCMPRR